ncbi:MAG: ATP-binding protein [Flavipsychrobacter sp.]|nr:ATP-binding protein [Flavipsychrobacter sp.]
MATKKIVVIGPESTGKSTLSKAIAQKCQTLWVPEYARDYIASLDRQYTEADLTTIASGQIATEDILLPQCPRLLVCDTDLYVLKVWSEHAFGRCNSQILHEIATRQYDMYLLTYIDVAWEYDEQREHADPGMREYFYKQYRDIVINSGVPWYDIRGNEEERLQTALTAINKLP